MWERLRRPVVRNAYGFPAMDAHSYNFLWAGRLSLRAQRKPGWEGLPGAGKAKPFRTASGTAAERVAKDKPFHANCSKTAD